MLFLQDYVTNALLSLDVPRYAAIIGRNPSKGARSPLLWNSAFDAQGIAAKMIALDVEEKFLTKILDLLEGDPNFLGGAISAPYKELVAKWLGSSVTAHALEIGSVNSLYRNEHGKLVGTNTDGEAALASYTERFGPVDNKNILVLGFGGAGKAVTSYFARAMKSDNRLYVGGRNQISLKNCPRNLSFVHWDDLEKVLLDVDVLINCTSLGTGQTTAVSPISKKSIATLKSTTIAFDINYQPAKTLFLEHCETRGLSTLNGFKMNYEQAVLAFEYALKGETRPGLTREAMHRLTR